MIDLGTRAGVLDEVKEELLNSRARVRRHPGQGDHGAAHAGARARPREHPRRGPRRGRSRASTAASPSTRGAIDNVVGVLYVKAIVDDLRKGIDRSRFQHRQVPAPAVLRAGDDEDLAGCSRSSRSARRTSRSWSTSSAAPAAWCAWRTSSRRSSARSRTSHDVEEGPMKVARRRQVPRRGRRCPSAISRSRFRCHFPEDGDYETLGGFLTATAGPRAAHRRAHRLERPDLHGAGGATTGASPRSRSTRSRTTGSHRRGAAGSRESSWTCGRCPRRRCEALVARARREALPRAASSTAGCTAAARATFDEMTDLPQAFRQALAERAELPTLAIDATQKSTDGTIKYRLRTVRRQAARGGVHARGEPAGPCASRRRSAARWAARSAARRRWGWCGTCRRARSSTRSTGSTWICGRGAGRARSEPTGCSRTWCSWAWASRCTTSTT